ncbi:MAG: N-acetyltransferase [Nitrospira sp.]|nr:N-acetyltransferase [Nitrospira sp.]
MAIHPTARIHEKALVDDCEIGPDTRVWAFAHVLPRAKVGARCNLGESVFVESGAVIGDECIIKNGVAIWEGVELGHKVFIGPNAVFTNIGRPRAARKDLYRARFSKTYVAEGVTIGANATIVCGISVGRYAFIGAGTVVLRDVPAYGLIVGNPGRLKGWVCRCAVRLNDNLECLECGQRYQKERDGLVEL